MTYIIDCPETHTFAYFGGKYCCEYGVENILPGYGQKCDGGPISSSSVCCKDHAYTKCSSMWATICGNRGR